MYKKLVFLLALSCSLSACSLLGNLRFGPPEAPIPTAPIPLPTALPEPRAEPRPAASAQVPAVPIAQPQPTAAPTPIPVFEMTIDVPIPTFAPTSESSSESSVPGLLGIQTVSPDSIEVNVGQSRAVAGLVLNIRTTNSEGQTVETLGFLNDLSKASWASGNTSVASISASGTILGVAVGKTAMTVTYGGFSRPFTVEVTSNN